MKISLLIIVLCSHIIASDYIDVYSAYSNGKRVVVQGRVVDIKDKKSKESKLIGSFFTDEKKEINIRLKVKSEYYRGKSDNEGYFFFDIDIATKIDGSVPVWLETNDKKSLQKIQLFQPTKRPHLGVISDFDDTVIVSDVKSKTKLLYNTFFKNYKERTLVDKVKDKIFRTIKLNGLSNKTALFFITGSPHQFHHAINTVHKNIGKPMNVTASQNLQRDFSTIVLVVA